MLQLQLANFELWQLFVLPFFFFFFRFVSLSCASFGHLMAVNEAQNCCIVCHPLNMQTTDGK